MKRFAVMVFFLVLMFPDPSAGVLRDEITNRGLRNDTVLSYELIEKAHNEPDKAREYAEQAVLASPDLPAGYFHLAWVTIAGFSPKNFLEGLNYLVQGLGAYKRNFWWSFSLSGIIYMSILITIIPTVFLIVLVRLPLDLPLINHEIREEGKHFVIFILVFIMSIMGPLFFLAAMLLLVSFYFQKGNIVFTYAVFGLLILLPLLLRPVEVYYSAALSPEVKAIVAVNQGNDNSYAFNALAGKEGTAELFTLALAQKREGKIREAIVTYNRILKQSPGDSRVLNNLANCYAILQRYDEAKEAYERALESGKRASVYYNLSQISRDRLLFEEGDRFFDEARKVDPDAVAEYRSTASMNPNRLYVDLTLDNGDLWKYAFEKRGRKPHTFAIIPTWLTPIVGIMIFISLFIFSRMNRNKAYSCRRCGVIICHKCERSLKWGSMCHDCFTALVSLEKDPRDRIAKIMSVYDKKRSKRSIIMFLSFLFPGLHLVYARKIVKGAGLLFLFLLPPAVYIMNALNDFPIYPYSQIWLFFFLAPLMPIIYILNVILTRRFLKKWV